MALRGEVSYSDHGGDGPFDHSQRSEAAVEDQALWLGKPCDAVSPLIDCSPHSARGLLLPASAAQQVRQELSALPH
jgi:hypothetical protein